MGDCSGRTRNTSIALAAEFQEGGIPVTIAAWTRKGVALAFLLALATFAASTARADLIGSVSQLALPTCGTNSHPFAQFGDNNSYFPFTNNGFESGTWGWSVSGATSIVTGNEPWYVNGAGNRSLLLGAGATAASPLVCVSLVDPDWRMFVKSNANGALHAQIVFYGLLGNVTGVLNAADFDAAGFASWGPSPTVNSLLALPLATQYAQLRLTNTASSGSWQVDDVFADPWEVRG